MSEAENLSLAEKLFENINLHDARRNLEFQAPFYQFEFPGADGPMSRDQSAAYFQGFINAFPDLHFDLKEKIAQGDFVAIRWIATGTHTGPLRTPAGAILPPTNRKGNISGCIIIQIKNGQALRGWWYWDMATLLSQLGLVPAM